jgi:Rod binding domain-containing protein
MMQSLAGASFPPLNAGPTHAQQVRKLDHAAQAFEGILIGSLWKSLQKDPLFSSNGADPGAGTMSNLGLQAVSSAIAARGGLGLAKMIERELAPALGGAPPDTAAKSLKPSSAPADKLDVQGLP